MSILSNLSRGIRGLLNPRRCPVCGERIIEGEYSLCTICRTTAPLTGYWLAEDNPVVQHCRKFLPVERASGFMFFVHESGWRQLIHSFKYRGRWAVAEAMGRWYGRCLKQSGLYDTIDCVVPLPLHPFKRLKRGYNQSEYIARGIARELGVELDTRSVFRSKNTQSQALKSRRDRLSNVENAFSVRRPECLARKHILIVDDVMTTGSTLLSCADAVLKAVPDCRISIAALAVSRRELGVEE